MIRGIARRQASYTMTNDVQISERELEILRLVATGATNQQIAQQLNISINTVKVHLRNIFGKIGAASRTEATVYAIRSGLVMVSGEGEATEPALPFLTPSSDDPDPTDLAEVDLAALPLAAPAGGPGVAIPPAPASRRGGLARGGLVAAGLAVVAVVVAVLLIRNAPVPTPDPTALVAAPTQVGPNARWFSRAPLPNPRSAFALAAFDLERELYAIGGIADGAISGAVDRYDPASDLWVSLTEKPTPVSHAGAVALRGKIYVPGGEDGAGHVRDTLDIFDPRQGDWEQGPALPAARSRYALVAWEGRIYLIGGWDGTAVRGEVFIFDPETAKWSDGQPLGTPRRNAGAVISGGRLYVVGGEGSSGPLRDAVQLEPGGAGGAGWGGIAPLPRPMAAPAMVAPVSTVLVFDATAREGFQYDQVADAWLAITIPPEATLGTAAQLNSSIYFVADPATGAPGALGEYLAVYTVFLPNR
jgi:DNA-binding CsgD family transcriptional regulator